MTRTNQKPIACCQCGQPARVASECVRYLCGPCALKGHSFPRMETGDLFAREHSPLAAPSAPALAGRTEEVAR